MSLPALLAATTDAYDLTSGRLVGAIAAVVALTGTTIGALALTRAAGRGAGNGPMIAVTAGVAGVLAGGWVVVTADGGPGSGSGIVGGFVALLLGSVAVLLGALARTRSRRPS